MEFKICSIGCGNHAARVHGPSYKRYAAEHPEAIMAACCDIDGQKARIFMENFGFRRCYTDFVEMLDSERPSAVCLISPVEYTADLAARILEMGYPLLLEKPPGKSTEEVKKLIEIAEKGEIPNMVAFNRRYAPLIRELKKLLTKNYQPSDIQSINYSITRIDRRDVDFSTTAIHGIDAVRFIAGSDYKHVEFHYQELPHLGVGVKNIYMDCSMMSGAVARIDLCPVAGVVIERAVVNTYDRTYFLNTPMWEGFDSPGRLICLDKGQVIYDAGGDTVSDGTGMFESGGFYFENATFFENIKHGKIPSGNLKSSLQSVEVAECIRLKLAEYDILQQSCNG